MILGLNSSPKVNIVPCIKYHCESTIMRDTIHPVRKWNCLFLKINWAKKPRLNGIIPISAMNPSIAKTDFILLYLFQRKVHIHVFMYVQRLVIWYFYFLIWLVYYFCFNLITIIKSKNSIIPANRCLTRMIPLESHHSLSGRFVTHQRCYANKMVKRWAAGWCRDLCARESELSRHRRPHQPSAIL